jgi:3-oxoadipate enol-lactonase
VRLRFGAATAELGALRVRYYVAGDGPPTVLVHGIAQDHTMWTAQQHELRDLTTVAYDLRGHGGTTLGRADGSLAQLGDDLVALLERLGPSHCVGFSLGGAVALWAATERPDLVERVVAIATSSVVGPRAVADLTRRMWLVRAGGADAVREILRRDTRAQLDPGFDAAAPIVAERLRAARDPRGYLNALRAIAGMSDGSLHDRLPRLHRHVLAVAAEHDDVCPPRAAELLLAALPDARLELIPGAHHLVGYSDPATVTNLIRAELSEAACDGS